MKFDTTYSNAVIQAAQKEMQEEIQIRSESEKNISILLTAGSGGALFVMAGTDSCRIYENDIEKRNPSNVGRIRRNLTETY